MEQAFHLGGDKANSSRVALAPLSLGIRDREPIEPKMRTHKILVFSFFVYLVYLSMNKSSQLIPCIFAAASQGCYPRLTNKIAHFAPR